MAKKAKKKKTVELTLPKIKVSSGTTLTIFEIGNVAFGLFPTTKELQQYRDLIAEALDSKNPNTSIFVPEGFVKVKQVTL